MVGSGGVWWMVCGVWCVVVLYCSCVQPAGEGGGTRHPISGGGLQLPLQTLGKGCWYLVRKRVAGAQGGCPSGRSAQGAKLKSSFPTQQIRPGGAVVNTSTIRPQVGGGTRNNKNRLLQQLKVPRGRGRCYSRDSQPRPCPPPSPSLRLLFSSSSSLPRQ